MKNIGTIVIITIWSLLAIVNFIGSFFYGNLFLTICGFAFAGINTSAIIGFIIMFRDSLKTKKLEKNLKQQDEL